MKETLFVFYSHLFTNRNYNPKKELNAALFFAVFIFVGLGIDSVFFANTFFDGRWIMNLFAIIHFLYFFSVASTSLRKLMFVMVFLGYLGELLFCNVFDMYDYRTSEIPLYVPFGHAILYATGLVCAQSDWAKKNQELTRKFFKVFFFILLLGVGIFLFDILSLIYGVCFFIVMRRRNWSSLFLFVSIWVILLELVGTYYQCWGWHSTVFGFIPTVNPPMGAIFIYVGGDIVLNKLVHSLDRKLAYIRVKV
jgi:hypothetical protein